MTSLAPRIIRRLKPAYQISRDCDCACSTSVGELVEDTLPVGTLLHRTPHLVNIPLSDTYRVIAAPTAGPAVLNAPARQILDAFESPQTWESLSPAWEAEWGKPLIGALYADLVELRFLRANNAPPVQNRPDTLSAWLHITDRCNLRCSYCYSSHSSSDMSLETGRAAIDATIRSALHHGYRSVKLKYAGGEPLLCFEMVVGLHHYAKSEAEKHDLTLTEVVLSNGTRLTTDTVKQMQALGLKLMISLDDLGDTSKPQRLYPDGRSAALDAMRAVELALAYDLVPDISITVSGRNAGDLPTLMRWVLARDLPFNLNFYRENDRSAQKTDLQLEEQRIISGMHAVYRIIEANLPRHTLLAALVDRADLATPHQHTCSAGHSYLVFNARGEVSKCQMVLDEVITDLNSPDPLLDIQLDQTSIINPPVDTKTGCQSCEWRYWCGGGCPLQTHRTSGTYNAPSPNCNIYRTLYPEVVRLEGLRLLRYGS